MQKVQCWKKKYCRSPVPLCPGVYDVSCTPALSFRESVFFNLNDCTYTSRIIKLLYLYSRKKCPGHYGKSHWLSCWYLKMVYILNVLWLFLHIFYSCICWYLSKYRKEFALGSSCSAVELLCSPAGQRNQR